MRILLLENGSTLRKLLQRARSFRASQAPTDRLLLGDNESILSSDIVSTLYSPKVPLEDQLKQSSAYQKARAVEMEDLWQRNHALLQEKYTLST